MKKKIFLFGIIFLSLNSILYSQSGWFQQQSGLNVALYSLYFVNSNTGWVCGDSGKILKTTNGGNNWIQQNTPTLYPLKSIFFLNENIGWSSGGVVDWQMLPSRMIVLKTVNGGNNWEVSYFSNSSYTSFGSIYFTDELHGCVTEQGGTGSGSIGGLWLSSNGGYNWLPILSSITSYHDIQFTNQNTGWVLGRLSDDTGHDTSYILKSLNGGQSWNKIFQKSRTNLSSSHFINNYTGWISGFDIEISSGIVMKTTNGGINWENYFLGQLPYMNSIFFADYNKGWGCGSRIYGTINSGVNWMLQRDFDGNTYNSIYFIDSLTGWVCGYNGKILKTFTGGINSISSSNENSPNKFLLHQNYPNPFNPRTIINYELQVTSYITLKVYDALGKEVLTITDEKKSAGSYTVEFNRSDLPSGIYFYELRADGFSQVKRMILMK